MRLVNVPQTSVTSIMRVFLPVLLAALLGVGQAHSLICFSCNNQKNNWNCLGLKTCKNTDKYCVTVTAATGFGSLNLGYSLHKGCAQICHSENLNSSLGVASFSGYCCQRSLCNFSTAGLGLCASAPLLGLGILFSLLTLLQLAP